MLGNIGLQELLLFLLVVLILFGSKRIPDLARSLGQSIKEFKKAREDISDAIREEDEGRQEGRQQKATPTVVGGGGAAAGGGPTAPAKEGPANQGPQGPGAR